MAALPRVPTNNFLSYTLDAQIAAGGNVITLNQSVAGVIVAPGYCVIDRIDTAGNKTPTKREVKKFTGVSGATLTGVTSVDGTDQVHAVGAVVEMTHTVNHEEDLYDTLKVEHNDDGTHTLTIPVKATGAEVNTGTDDAKFATPKAIADSYINLSAYAEITTNFVSTTVGQEDIPNLAVTITIPTTRRIKITAFSPFFTNSGSAANIVGIYIREGATELAMSSASIATNYRYMCSVSCSVIAAAGSHTYKIAWVQTGAGTFTLNASATNPAFILVETV